MKRKTKQLGKLGGTFALTIFFDPLYGYDGAVHIRRHSGQNSGQNSPKERSKSPKKLCWMSSQSRQVT
ncbi:hypothetical protein ACKVWC_011423 [Pyricularia oryzae]